jgi:chromosome segregation ATPase
MDDKQITKQVSWLDEERRKDQTRMGVLENRLDSIEGNISSLSTLIKDHGSELTRLNTLISRMDSFDNDLLQLRLETKKMYDEYEKQSDNREEENTRIRRAEIRSMEESIQDVRNDIAVIPEIQRRMDARIEEESRLARLIDSARGKIDDIGRNEEDYTRTVRQLNDGRRQDAKRITDLQGEVTAIRKRVDEQRGQFELLSANQKKTDTRLNETEILETQRRKTLDKFLEEQSLRVVERNRIWKDWETRFIQIESQAAGLENHLQTLESTHRTIKQAQQTVEDLAEKVERRIIEISEVQRLTEERFRQEWVTFKADDQKRWTNYTLTTEEQTSGMTRQYEKQNSRVTTIDDELQMIKDLIGQMNDQTDKRLQALLAAVHDWVASFERSVGRSR